MTISMNNCQVTIYETQNRIEKAKSDLLTKLYYAREKDTMGGREVWLELLDMYYMQKYDEMKETIEAFEGSGQATRNACIRCLDTIIMEG